jgi:hypothetical protein
VPLVRAPFEAVILPIPTSIRSLSPFPLVGLHIIARRGKARTRGAAQVSCELNRRGKATPHIRRHSRVDGDDFFDTGHNRIAIYVLSSMKCVACLLVLLSLFSNTEGIQIVTPVVPGHTPQRTAAASQAASTPTHAAILRGEYGRYRANNDLLYYHLDVRVDPEKKFLSGKNTIRFRMLKDDTRIQLDLHEALKVDKILFSKSLESGVKTSKSQDQSPKPVLKYQRDSGAVFVDFPETLKAGRVYTIEFY